LAAKSSPRNDEANIEMEKLKMHSPDLSNDNIVKIRELFPGCVTEATDEEGNLRLAVDFDQLRQELSEYIVEGPQERYHLNWPGKREALLAANAPIAKTLRPCREESVNFDTTKNLFIEGDNLEALKLLQETYLGKIKMIYIDPPYNTGNDFLYEDDFSESTSDYLRKSQQSDEKGNRLVGNTNANGRFHSDWLSMIYPRLKLARSLLKTDGAIFISIDDNEYDNLRKVCDEVFGSQNFIATVIWQKVFSPKNTASYFSEDHDYIVVYAKNKSSWSPTLLPRSEESKARYKNPDDDPRGPWLSGAIQARNYYSKGQYEVTSPSGKKFSNPKGTYWRFSEERFEELDKDNRIWWGDAGDGVPRLKRFLSEVKDGVVPQTLWKFEVVGHTQEAKEELIKYVTFENTENILNSVKPSRLIKHAIRIGTAPDAEDIVLDFFAGSGPTAQAVLSLNEEDGGDRKYILVQLPEPLPAPEENVSTIADLAKSRIENVTAEIANTRNNGSSNDPLRKYQELGYRSLRVDSSNMADVYYTPNEVKQEDLLSAVDNIKPGRDNPEDLLFQVLVDWGVDLTLPIRSEEVQGRTVFFVNEEPYDLIACFDTGITEDLVKELAKYEPMRVVFRDNGFFSDAVKINVDQIFRQLSPATDVKSI
jgi:adenine-specific DNA-methyltransferase